MKLQRDWEAVYYQHHDEWDVIATAEGDEPQVGVHPDRYSLFDGDDMDTEEVCRLIAAAPHMLEACKSALERFKILERVASQSLGGMDPAYCMAIDVQKRLEDAIAKATGGRP